MFRRITSILVLGSMLMSVQPAQAMAADWNEYLFEDLSWTAEGTIGEAGDWSFGTGAGTQSSGTFNYLFEGLSWPDGGAEGSIAADSGFADTGNDGGADSDSFFRYLLEDIEWPNTTTLVTGGD